MIAEIDPPATWFYSSIYSDPVLPYTWYYREHKTKFRLQYGGGRGWVGWPRCNKLFFGIKCAKSIVKIDSLSFLMRIIRKKVNFLKDFYYSCTHLWIPPQRESKIPFFLTVLFVFRNMWATEKNKKQKNSSEIFSFISLFR